MMGRARRDVARSQVKLGGMNDCHVATKAPDAKVVSF
jgi:hypothetical protein